MYWVINGHRCYMFRPQTGGFGESTRLHCHHLEHCDVGETFAFSELFTLGSCVGRGTFSSPNKDHRPYRDRLTGAFSSVVRKRP